MAVHRFDQRHPEGGQAVLVSVLDPEELKIRLGPRPDPIGGRQQESPRVASGDVIEVEDDLIWDSEPEPESQLQDIGQLSREEPEGEDQSRVPLPLQPHIPPLNTERRRVYDAHSRLDKVTQDEPWCHLSDRHKTDLDRLLGVVHVESNPEQYASCDPAADYPGLKVWTAWGCSPHLANCWSEEVERRLLRSLRSYESVVGVGEAGLDITSAVEMVQQEYVLTRLLRIANLARLPVVLRCVETAIADHEAHSTLFHILQESWVPSDRAYLHGAYAPATVIRAFSEEFPNLYFGVGPKLLRGCHRYDSPQTETLRMIPLERLVVETDSPHETQGPWSAGQVFDEVCRWRGLEPGLLETVLTANFRRLFAHE